MKKQLTEKNACWTQLKRDPFFVPKIGLRKQWYFDRYLGQVWIQKNGDGTQQKSLKIGWNWAVCFHFWTKCAILSWNFLQNISNITQIRNGGKFKPRLVSHSYLLSSDLNPYVCRGPKIIKMYLSNIWMICYAKTNCVDDHYTVRCSQK